MTAATRIQIVHFGRFRGFVICAQTALIAAVLFGVEWAAHAAFGGSWVVDVFALIITFGMMAAFGNKASGSTVAMNRDELVMWAHDGAPPDIKAWRAGNTARPIEGRMN